MANNSQRISPQDQWLFDGEDNLVGVKNPNVHGQDMLPLLYSVDPVTNVVTADITVTTLTTTGNALIGDAATDTIAVQAGSAALPSIIKTGDTNTGIWFPAADTVAVSTAGVERMRIDSAGNVGIGGAATAQQKLRIAGTYPGGTGYSFPVDLEGVIDPSVASTAAYMVYSHPTVSAGTLPDLRHFSASPGAFTGTVTTQYGFIATSTLTGATNNYGFCSNIAAAANRYNFYAAGTADNYLAGRVGIGTGASANSYLRLGGNLFGSTFANATYITGQIQSDVTAQAAYVSVASSQASGFTTAALKFFSASQGTYSGTVTTQYGYFSESTLTGATNNYGFYSDISSAANRWNFYANGTAPNYFAGVTGIGITPAATSALTVAAGTTAVSSLNIPHGAAPTSPVNGDMWTTTAGLYIRINGSTVGPLS